MKTEEPKPHFTFPRWVDSVVKVAGAAAAAGMLFLIFIAVYAASPETLDVGYQPVQPVQYSHAMHAGELGIDCRYCHNTVEIADRAAIPPTQTCMNCHKTIMAKSEKMIPVLESYSNGTSIPWVRVHDLPDYVYFSHTAHVSKGVSCVECHGRVDKMEVVYQAKSLRMGWCLKCHRKSEAYLRPVEYVTKLDWTPEENQSELGRRLKEEGNIAPSADCSTCHR